MNPSTSRAIAKFLEFVQFADELSSGYRPPCGPPHTPERRAQPRHPARACVEVLPLDRRRNPCGDYRFAVVQNVSERGIALLADVPAQTEFLRVWLPVGLADSSEVLAEVAWRSPARGPGLIGGRLVSAESDGPSADAELSPVPLGSRC